MARVKAVVEDEGWNAKYRNSFKVNLCLHLAKVDMSVSLLLPTKKAPKPMNPGGLSFGCLADEARLFLFLMKLQYSRHR